MSHPEEEEDFQGVCRFCGTDCGSVRELFDENAALKHALGRIRTHLDEIVKEAENYIGIGFDNGDESARLQQAIERARNA